MTFHGTERMDHHTQEHLHEPGWVITLPLILLAIPSAFIGWFTVKPLLFGDFSSRAPIHVLPANNVLEHMAEEFHGSGAFLLTALTALPFWFATSGVVVAWLFFLKYPSWADKTERSLQWLHTVLVDKYGFDWFNQNVIVAGARALGGGLWRFGDQDLIDNGAVNGSARVVGWFSSVMRYAQSGYLYHYAFAMILGLASLLLWLIWRP